MRHIPRPLHRLMFLFRPPSGPLFLSNNWGGYWTERLAPFGIVFGSFWEQDTRFLRHIQGHGTRQCLLFGPLRVHSFCPITGWVIGQKDWLPWGPFWSILGAIWYCFGASQRVFLCESEVREPRLVHTAPGRMPGLDAQAKGCFIEVSRTR